MEKNMPDGRPVLSGKTSVTTTEIETILSSYRPQIFYGSTQTLQVMGGAASTLLQGIEWVPRYSAWKLFCKEGIFIFYEDEEK